MKITITLLTRDKSGRQRKTEIAGEFHGGMNELRKLWEAEQAINAHTSIRCHLTVHEGE
jgi:hypothetical protein